MVDTIWLDMVIKSSALSRKDLYNFFVKNEKDTYILQSLLSEFVN